MKPKQLTKLLQRLAVNHVFHQEAIDLLTSHYSSRRSATNKLSQLVKMGKVNKFEPITYGLRMPPLYSKQDIVNYLGSKK